MTVRSSAAIRNAAINGISAASLLDGDSGNATIEFYTSTVGSFGTTPAGTKLATLTYSRPSYGTPASGSAAAGVILPDVSIAATGTPGCFVVRDSSGVIHFDGSVTISGGGGDIQFPSVTWLAGETAAMSTLPISIPQS